MATLGPLPMGDATAECLSSDLLDRAGFPHAFFLRTGGASTGPYSSLNFSYSVGDEPMHVRRNFDLAATRLGVAAEKLYFLSQVHGADCVELQGDERHQAVLTLEGDALCSGSSGVACCVRTADCVPVLVADQATGRVLAVHAGWRGLVRGVIGSGLRQLGGNPSDWLVAIGPHIRAVNFEISDDVAAELAGCSAAAMPIRRDGWPKPHGDLSAITRAQVESAGVPLEQVDDVGGDTFGEPERFFSFRRDGRMSGRHLSGITPRG